MKSELLLILIWIEVKAFVGNTVMMLLMIM